MKLISEQRRDALQHVATLFCAVEYPQLLNIYIGIISDSRKNVPVFSHACGFFRMYHTVGSATGDV